MLPGFFKPAARRDATPGGALRGDQSFDLLRWPKLAKSQRPSLVNPAEIEKPVVDPGMNPGIPRGIVG